MGKVFFPPFQPWAKQVCVVTWTFQENVSTPPHPPRYFWNKEPAVSSDHKDYA